MVSTSEEYAAVELIASDLQTAPDVLPRCCSRVFSVSTSSFPIAGNRPALSPTRGYGYLVADAAVQKYAQALVRTGAWPRFEAPHPQWLAPNVNECEITVGRGIRAMLIKRAHCNPIAMLVRRAHAHWDTNASDIKKTWEP